MRANRTLCRTSDGLHGVFYGLLTADTAEEFVCAGHPYPLCGAPRPTEELAAAAILGLRDPLPRSRAQ